ncbi:MAG TPA: YhdP family protein [Burkholderiales bacterium]
MKRVGRAAEFLAWAVFFALAALVLALRFWLLPDIERHREAIVAAASRAVGQPVSIGGIDADWLGLHPRINLSNVRIHDAEGREVLALPRVENMLSWRALALGEIRLHSMVIDGLRLQVRRDAGGVLHVAGVRVGGGSGGFSAWALAQEEFVLRNAEIEWLDEQRGAPPLVLSALDLRLRNSGEEHALGLTAQPPAGLGSTVELRASLHGRALGELAAWSGRLYAELGYTDLAAWRAWIDYPWQVAHGEGALRLWLTLQGGELKRATGDVALSEVAASLGEGLAPLELASVSGRLDLGLAGDSYELAARGLALDMRDGPAIAPANFQVRWKPGASGAFAADAIELEPLARLAASLPLPAGARRVLAEVAPRGRLVRVRSDWSGPAEAPVRFTASGSFSGLAAEPSGELPGFAGISGSFEATEARGRVQLDSRQAELDLPGVLPGPRIELDTFNGQVEWARGADNAFSIRLLSVNFANDHLSGNAYGTWSRAGEGPGIADLSAQFNRVDASRIATYLPHARMMGGQATRDWLVRSIVAGRSGDVRFRLSGDLAEFPFTDPARGEFSVRAQIEDGVLDYAPGWPRIEAISGELLFEREGMQVSGRSGRVLGVALSGVRVEIPRLKEGRLTIDGQADGATGAFLAYLESTPVRAKAGGLTDSIKASGRGRLRLKLALPLKDLRKVRVAGEFDVLDNNVSVHPALPVIENAAGRIGFTESGVTLHDLRGRLLGGALTVGGGTRADGSVEIAARGRATAEGARPFFDHPLGSHFIGAADYAVLVSSARGRTRFLLESALRGVASTLPAPFGKSAEDDFELRLEIVPLEDGARDYASLTLGRVARAVAMRIREGERMALQRAAVALTPAAGARVRLPQQPGVLVYGDLPGLDLDRWLPLLAKAGPGAGNAAFNVKIGALDLYGKRLHEAAVRGESGADGWSGSVAARELAGDVSWRGAQGGKLVARLTQFRMPDDYPGALPREPIAPADLPSVDLSADRFDYRGRQFGRVELAAQRAGSDLRIDRLTMANPDASFMASGVWRSGTPSLSALEFDLQASDAGGLLNRLGYRDLVKGSKARLQGSLSWIGVPTAIDYPSLAGQVKLEADHGQFLEIEPGLGKLLALMSLQSLPRRMTFDFRDVFSKGFEFEHIASSGQIAGGVMALQDFHMRGATADVAMTGKVDLARETQDLRVRVMPSLGGSASTVIALVNPLLAIPAAIAQKILKDPLGQIFAFNYAVTGGWAEPNVERLGVEAQPAETQ